MTDIVYKRPEDVFKCLVIHGRANCGFCTKVGQHMTPWCTNRKNAPQPGYPIQNQICKSFKYHGKMKYDGQLGFLE